MNEALVEQVISEWIQQWVLGFSLCPFAAKPYHEKRIRIKVYTGNDLEALRSLIMTEAKRLVCTSPDELETTLVVSPLVLKEFLEYWEYFGLVEDDIVQAKYEGILQIASFHPGYYFDNTNEDDVSNFTNRSPFPVFHILRESSVSKAIDSYPDIQGVPNRNVQFMSSRSYQSLKDRLDDWRARVLQ